MDIATIVGIIIATTALTTSFAMEGGAADSVFLLAPMILVIGGTFGVAVMGGSGRTFWQIPTYLRIAIRGEKQHFAAAVDHLVKISERARREGILSLEKDLAAFNNRFFTKAALLVIDGVDAPTLSDIMETEIHCITQRHKKGIDFFTRLGGFSPTLGILGTVLALVHTLGNVNNPEKMATAIASAFIATLWGVGMANMVYLPLADKLRSRHEEEVAFLDMMTEGALAIQAGESPRLMRRRLQSFLPPDVRGPEYL